MVVTKCGSCGMTFIIIGVLSQQELPNVYTHVMSKHCPYCGGNKNRQIGNANFSTTIEVNYEQT